MISKDDGLGVALGGGLGVALGCTWVRVGLYFHITCNRLGHHLDITLRLLENALAVHLCVTLSDLGGAWEALERHLQWVQVQVQVTFKSSPSHPKPSATGPSSCAQVNHQAILDKVPIPSQLQVGLEEWLELASSALKCRPSDIEVS